ISPGVFFVCEITEQEIAQYGAAPAVFPEVDGEVPDMRLPELHEAGIQESPEAAGIATQASHIYIPQFMLQYGIIVGFNDMRQGGRKRFPERNARYGASFPVYPLFVF